MGLEGFERKSMAAPEFKELVRRTFHLKLSGTEVGALFDFFNNSDAPEVSEVVIRDVVWNLFAS